MQWSLIGNCMLLKIQFTQKIKKLSVVEYLVVVLVVVVDIIVVVVVVVVFVVVVAY